MAARSTDSGSIEFAIQQKLPDGAWSEYIFGRGRFFTERLHDGNWKHATPVLVEVPVPHVVAEETLIEDDPSAYWFVETYYDPIDDTPTYHVISDSSAVISKEWGYSSLDDPSIVLKCHGSTFDAYVNWDTLVFGRFSDDTVGVQWRIDSRPAKSERWLESTSNYATFSRQPETFARALLGGSELTIRATDREGEEFTARFYLDGLSDSMDTLTCFRP
ncbi:MAG: hypothetical protein OXC94_03965 [Chloroflexi bacterium]|nr:hypothetical protein [Chloroflexota bacterium]